MSIDGSAFKPTVSYAIVKAVKSDGLLILRKAGAESRENVFGPQMPVE